MKIQNSLAAICVFEVIVEAQAKQTIIKSIGLGEILGSIAKNAKGAKDAMYFFAFFVSFGFFAILPDI